MNHKYEVAKHFVSRAKAQGMKGKKRDEAAVEFAVGAAALAAAVFGGNSAEWGEMATLAYFVSLNGYAEFERIWVQSEEETDEAE